MKNIDKYVFAINKNKTFYRFGGLFSDEKGYDNTTDADPGGTSNVYEN